MLIGWITGKVEDNAKFGEQMVARILFVRKSVSQAKIPNLTV